MTPEEFERDANALCDQAQDEYCYPFASRRRDRLITAYREVWERNEKLERVAEAGTLLVRLWEQNAHHGYPADDYMKRMSAALADLEVQK